MRTSFLTWLAMLIWRRPKSIIAFSLVLATACVWHSSQRLTLNANTDDLISPNRPYMIEYRKFLQEFGDLEYIYVVVENTGDAQRTETVVDALTERLRNIDGLNEVHSTITPSEQLRIATRAVGLPGQPAMSDQELADLATASAAFPALLSGEGPARVLHDAMEFLDALIKGGRKLPEAEQERLGAAATLLLKIIAAVSPNSPSRTELDSLMATNLKPEYLKSSTGKLYFINIEPVKDYSTLSVIEKPLQQIREALYQVRIEYPGVPIGLTGKPVLQADEMATSNDDMTKASALAFIVCGLLFIVMIGGVLRPLLAMIAFAIGSAWTYGAASILVGQLNLLSIVFMLVLIGVALDYGVHVISRYREHRLHAGVQGSITATMLTAVRGNITGALTSSTVFFMALFTTFQGLRELGLIAGVGLLLSLIAISLVLPALLVLIDGWRSNANEPLRINQAMADEHQSGMLSWAVNKPVFVLVGAAAMSLAFAAALAGYGIRFEFNLLKLQAVNLESVEWERRILEDSASASWFGAAIAESEEKALEFIDRAKRQATIGDVHSVFDVIAPESDARQNLRKHLNDGAIDRLLETKPTESNVEKPWSIDDLRKPLQPLGLIASGAASEAPKEAAILRQLSEDLQKLAEALQNQEQAKGVPAQTPSVRGEINRTVQSVGDSLRRMLAGNSLDLRAALPDALRKQYMSPDNQYLVMLHPKENVWEYEPMRQFIEALRAVDPQVTGAPITHFESLGEMLRSFIIMSILAFAVIVVIVWLDFRSWRDVALAVLPLLLSLVWTIGVMDLFGISFNLANFFSVPILIGLGVDASVHVLHRYHEGGPTRFHLGATRRAVMLTALTTIIGFGTLIMAHHRGLRSLGLVMTIGSTCCMITSIVVLPALLAWLEKRQSSGTPVPGTGTVDASA